MRLFAIAAGVAALLGQALALPPGVALRHDGAGPYDRLVIRSAILIDGSGAPPFGPVDVVVENNRITEIISVGDPGLAIMPTGRPPLNGGKEIDATGKYLLPGFVNLHGHIHSYGTGQDVPPDYVFKLWLMHGITTVREVGNDKGAKFTAELSNASVRNLIDSPRLYPFPYFGSCGGGKVNTPAEARAEIRTCKKLGAVGIKFFDGPEEVLWAAFDEAKKLDLKTTMHHAQLAVAHADVLDTSAHGLNSMEHWYGLPEAMFVDRALQDYPVDYNYSNEQHRFGEAGKLWAQAAEQGSDRWNYVRDTLLQRNFSIIPTFTIYLSSRDWMRARRAEWHDDFTMPSLWKYYAPDRNAHGSYWFDWGTEQEVAWRRNYQKWMAFINEYKNHGGKVGVGEDAGYIYSTYGFGYIQELELLREAGFNPLEVIRAATLEGARILGAENEIGSVRVGKMADLVIVGENPLANLKVLYASGHIKLDPATNKPVRVGGVETVIKDGIVYDARVLAAEVKAMVAAEKEKAGIAPGPMPIVDFNYERKEPAQ